MVGLAFVVVGIGASIIYFFWSRWYEDNLKPVTDNNKTEELKIIKAEYKKEEEIKPQEKKEVTTVLPKSDKIIDSDNLGAAAPADQIRNTNLNGALAPRKDAMASKNNLEENNMCMGGSNPKKEEPKLKVNRVGSMTVGPKIFTSSISSIKSMKYSNDESHINPNDINGSFEYKNANNKMLNGINNKMDELLNQKVNDAKQEIKKEMDDKLSKSEDDMNNLKEQVKKNTEDINKNTEDIKKTQEEQIDIKKMIAEMKEENKDSKIRVANSERMLEKMEEDRKNQEKKYEEDKKKSEENQKAHDEVMRYLWDKLDEWNGIKNPTREGNDNRESTNTSFSSFKYKNPFRNNTRQPRMERPDMAHDHNNEY